MQAVFLIRWPLATRLRGHSSWESAWRCSNTRRDPQNGAPINSNYADYIVPVNADVPQLEVHFLDYPDKEANPLGARGIGEIGLAGVAAAITGAAHHATGVRVRELPVKIENLLS